MYHNCNKLHTHTHPLPPSLSHPPFLSPSLLSSGCLSYSFVCLVWTCSHLLMLLLMMNRRTSLSGSMHSKSFQLPVTQVHVHAWLLMGCCMYTYMYIYTTLYLYRVYTTLSMHLYNVQCRTQF